MTPEHVDPRSPDEPRTDWRGPRPTPKPISARKARRLTVRESRRRNR